MAIGDYQIGNGMHTTIYPSNYGIKQLVEIKTVQLKHGHVGQIWFRDQIVWESLSQETAHDAYLLAEKHLTEALS